MANNKKKKSKPGGRPGPKPAASSGSKQAKPQAKQAKLQAEAGAGVGAGPRKPTREERWEAERRARRRQAMVRRAIGAGVVAALLGGLVVWQLDKRRDNQAAIKAMTARTCEFDTKSDPGQVNEHSPNATFKLEPPSGGVHSPSVAQPGVYIDRQPPPDNQIVHALEHGDIAVWFKPGIPQDQIDALRDVAASRENDVLLIPRPQLGTQFAATAWHKRLLCDEVDVPALRRFISRYADKGPEGKGD